MALKKTACLFGGWSDHHFKHVVDSPGSVWLSAWSVLELTLKTCIFLSLWRSDWKIMLWVIELPILWGIKQCLKCMCYVCVDLCCWDCTQTHTHTHLWPADQSRSSPLPKKHAIKFNLLFRLYFSFDENLKKGRIKKRKQSHRFHGTGIFTYKFTWNFTIQINHSWIGKYTVPWHAMTSHLRDTFLSRQHFLRKSCRPYWWDYEPASSKIS